VKKWVGLEKEERVSFKRDEAGRVVDVERRDIAAEKRAGARYARIEKRATAQELRERKRAKFEALRERKRAKRKARKQEYSEAYDDDRHKARVKLARVRGAQSGSMSFTDRLNSIPSMGSYSTRNNYNPFGTMFDTGLGYKKPYKSKNRRVVLNILSNQVRLILLLVLRRSLRRSLRRKLLVILL